MTDAPHTVTTTLLANLNAQGGVDRDHLRQLLADAFLAGHRQGFEQGARAAFASTAASSAVIEAFLRAAWPEAGSA